jgi:uncharacterized protein (DUF2236 family)
MPDTGRLEPSVARRINGERVVVLGWTRAILLQLAHPLVAAGVHEHSRFRESPWAAAARLHSTIRAMLALTFGDEEATSRALEGILAIHRRVRGHLGTSVGCFPAGTPYSAEDPALVLWVHLTLLESLPLAYETLVRPLASGDRDAYCAESAWAAVRLGARAGEVPRSWRDAMAAMDDVRAAAILAVGPDARELARVLMSPAPVRAFPPLGWAHRLLTAGLLPPALRASYGIGWTSARQRRFDRVTSLVRHARRAVPDALARWPQARCRP